MPMNTLANMAVPITTVLIQHTTPCSLDDAADLATELRRIGYRLRPIKRASRIHHDRRRQIAADLRRTM